jgi:hypothetical protein
LTADTTPDGAADYLMSYDASASALKKILLNKATAYKTQTFGRDTSTASGSQGVTGVGFTPKAVIFFAVQQGTSEVSIGFDDGVAPLDIYNNHGAAADTWGVDTSFSITALESGTAFYQGKVSSFDSDGFTIAWTKTGSPTGTLQVNYLALR